MRSALWLLVLWSASCSALPAPPASVSRPRDPFDDHFYGSVLLGARELDDDWEPVEDQFAIGFEFAGRPGESFVGWEIGVSGSSEEERVTAAGETFDFSGNFFELYGGARFWLADSDARVLPYLGVGLSVVNAEAEGSDDFAFTSEDDTSAGLYFHGGLLFPIGETFHLGLDARGLVGTEIDVFDFETDADYRQLAFVLAWRW
jgi:hypothetical protein